MHSRRVACFLLGIWFGAAILMAWVGIESFRSVDRLMAKPSPAALLSIKTLGPAGARMLLRYQASEQNRWLFEAWGTVQLIGGTGFFLFLLLGTREGKYPLILVLLMLVAVLLQLFLLTPAIISLGRLVDFLPPGQPSGERNRFWVLHSAYLIVEALKWTVGLLLGVRLMRRRGRSSDSREYLDMVDKADHRHVNG